jgi:hypothetical protein
MQLKDVNFYREQAKRMRRIGANAISLDVTMQLVAIAQQFERLADFVEREVAAEIKARHHRMITGLLSVLFLMLVRVGSADGLVVEFFSQRRKRARHVRMRIFHLTREPSAARSLGAEISGVLDDHDALPAAFPRL